MDQGGEGTTKTSFPQLTSAFVAVGTEFARKLVPATLCLFQRHPLAVETGGAQQFPLVVPLTIRRLLFLSGMAAYKPSQLVSQWVQQPQRTQGQL